MPDPDYEITLRPLTGVRRGGRSWDDWPPERRLRAALKALLRSYGLRNVALRAVPRDDAKEESC